MAETELDRDVAAVRHFNRFYTKAIGVLGEGLLASPFSLAQARVLYELAHREDLTATEIGRELDLDAGYLSRILRGFAQRRLIERRPSAADGRQSLVRLTKPGRAAFAALDRGSRAEAGRLLRRLSPTDRERVVEAMRRIEGLLSPGDGGAGYVLRPHRPGDMGWVVGRHGELYAREYSFDESFEALVAEIAAQFIRGFDAKRERCWIAERDGETVGSVFLVAHSTSVAKLRLLLVDPKGRGLGIGARLVEECLSFARQAGYRKVTLWTQSILLAARHIYQGAGFRLVRAEPHRSFGQDLVGETWEMSP
jgi:DNA-binding MarR family transcriptional regulator/GNAT superfamily N-acetyltransferase